MDNMHTKEKLRMVLKTFDPPYLHAGATKVAVIANTGTLSEDEQIEIAQRLVKGWNEYDGLVEALKKIEYGSANCKHPFHDKCDAGLMAKVAQQALKQAKEIE